MKLNLQLKKSIQIVQRIHQPVLPARPHARPPAWPPARAPTRLQACPSALPHVRTPVSRFGPLPARQLVARLPARRPFTYPLTRRIAHPLICPRARRPPDALLPARQPPIHSSARAPAVHRTPSYPPAKPTHPSTPPAIRPLTCYWLCTHA